MEHLRPSNPILELSKNLTALRARRRLSQAVLCTRAGVSRDTLSRIERGEADPTLSVLGKLATALQVTAADLLGGARNTNAAHTVIDEVVAADAARYSNAGRPRRLATLLATVREQEHELEAGPAVGRESID